MEIRRNPYEHFTKINANTFADLFEIGLIDPVETEITMIVKKRLGGDLQGSEVGQTIDFVKGLPKPLRIIAERYLRLGFFLPDALKEVRAYQLIEILPRHLKPLADSLVKNGSPPSQALMTVRAQDQLNHLPASLKAVAEEVLNKKGDIRAAFRQVVVQNLIDNLPADLEEKYTCADPLYTLKMARAQQEISRLSGPHRELADALLDHGKRPDFVLRKVFEIFGLRGRIQRL